MLVTVKAREDEEVHCEDDQDEEMVGKEGSPLIVAPE